MPRRLLLSIPRHGSWVEKKLLYFETAGDGHVVVEVLLPTAFHHVETHLKVHLLAEEEVEDVFLPAFVDEVGFRNNGNGAFGLEIDFHRVAKDLAVVEINISGHDGEDDAACVMQVVLDQGVDVFAQRRALGSALAADDSG